MFGAIASFFGGAAFRAIWGELSAFFKARQDHQFEHEMLLLQMQIDAAQHGRNLESMRLQHDMGVEVIHLQAEVDMERMAAMTFDRGVELTGKLTGFKFVDIWNGIIRPGLATECAILWSLDLYRRDWYLADMDWSLIFAVFGLYLADRALAKRGR